MIRKMNKIHMRQCKHRGMQRKNTPGTIKTEQPKGQLTESFCSLNNKENFCSATRGNLPAKTSQLTTAIIASSTFTITSRSVSLTSVRIRRS
jgi:hypothetical protein